MQIRFEKWHGCLNDFAVIWLSDLDGDVVLDSLKRQAVKLCDRHGGIGADGLLVLTTRKRDDLDPYKLTIINSDASIAKNCGNGLRCAASSVLKNHRDKGVSKETPDAVELEVEGATMVCRFMKKGVAYPFVAVDMGVPTVGKGVKWRDAAMASVKEVAAKLGKPALARDVEVCDIGNPHLVITTEEASRELVLAAGPALQMSDAYDGINVHIVKAATMTDKDHARARQDLGHGAGDLGEAYTAYVWERGAGETMACGSGACAVAATALASGLVDRSSWIAVDMPGGRLYVRHEAEDEPAVLAGPATFVYGGTVEI